MPSHLTPPVHQLLCVVSLLYLLINNCSSGHVTELVLDDDIPHPVVIDSTYVVPNSPETERLCHVEYQIMKRSIGKCVKLGRNLKGCASGNYIQPLHPECMSFS